MTSVARDAARGGRAERSDGVVQIRLTATGRRSGLPRSVTLYAWEDGDELIVVGSSGGSAHDPAWAANLRENPAATVHQGRAERAVRARELRDAEHERAWTLVVEQFPLYATYQRRTARTIPLFALEAIDRD